MANIINSNMAPRLLVPALDAVFGLEYKKFPSVHDKIYETRKSMDRYAESVKLRGVGMAEIKAEGSTVGLDDIAFAEARRTLHVRWGKKIRITDEEFKDNHYLKYATLAAKQLAKALFYAKADNAAALFNNADSTSAPYVGEDGKALLATDHVLYGGGSASNTVTADISELALENALINIKGFVDDRGLKILADVKALVIPRASVFDVHRILKSKLRPGTADNDANAMLDMGEIPQIIAWDFLTDSDSWFLINDIPEGFMHFVREAPEMVYHQNEDTRDHIYSMYERYVFDYRDWRAVYGSVGA